MVKYHEFVRKGQNKKEVFFQFPAAILQTFVNADMSQLNPRHFSHRIGDDFISHRMTVINCAEPNTYAYRLNIL